jgi:hypothetical protein
LVVEPNYLLDSEVFFSHAWSPFHSGGVWGGFPLHNCLHGGAPPGGGFEGSAPEEKYWENFLVKYCNFVVNLDRSL